MKKTILLLFLLCISTLIFWNCQEKKVISDTEYEQAVLYEIIPAILDSIYYDKRIPIPPPPPPGFFDKEKYKTDINTAIEDYRKSDRYKSDMANMHRVKDSLKNDPAPVFLVVSDSVNHFEKTDPKALSKHFKIPDSLIKQSGKDYKIDLNRLKSNNEKIKFKYRSAYPEAREFWRTDYGYFIAANIGFSRILFDKTKTYGVLNFGFTMDILNGSGFRIFIKKNRKGKWLIDKIEGTWIS